MNYMEKALDIYEVVEGILSYGPGITTLINGPMGNGKTQGISSLLRERLPTHDVIIINCAGMQDQGDLSMPANLNDLKEEKFVKFTPRAGLGFDSERPVILILDEIWKAPKACHNTIGDTVNEQRMNDYHLPEGSYVIGLSNLEAEGLGDEIGAHLNDRVVEIFMKPLSVDDLLVYGAANGWDTTMLTFIKETPAVTDIFLEHADPESNPYIYHPQSTRKKFFSPRSAERASTVLKGRAALVDRIGVASANRIISAGVNGSVGEVAGEALMAMVRLGDDLVSFDQIKDDPDGTPVSSNPAANYLLLFKALAAVDRSWVDQWMTYMYRLPAEVQMLFMMIATRNEPKAGSSTDAIDKWRKRRDFISSAKGAGDWHMANKHLFA
jgi:hypothetical protein